MVVLYLSSTTQAQSTAKVQYKNADGVTKVVANTISTGQQFVPQPATLQVTQQGAIVAEWEWASNGVIGVIGYEVSN